MGDELQKFLREHTEQLRMDDVLPSLEYEEQETDHGGLRWQKALRWCPKGLLELVNSRACRGFVRSLIHKATRLTLSRCHHVQ